MVMNGIDISNYQTGIDLAAVPCDFVIILVSEDGGVVNPDWRRQCEQALSLGKPTMLYHYVGGHGAVMEADVFASATKDYRGRAAFAVDWETGSNAAWGNEGYCEQLVARLKADIGRTVVLYGMASAYPRGVANRQQCPTWVAQYADKNPTGYQDSPWNQGTYQADIRQYASTGRLNGWAGNLDLNKSYATREQWAQWAGNEEEVVNQNDINAIAEAVWDFNQNGVLMRDRVQGIDQAANHVADSVWNADINKVKARDRLYGMDSMQLPALRAQVAAQDATIQALSKANGIDPKAVTDTVTKAVAEKLASLKVSVA
ncbi:hypothetical protein DDE84_01095 [Bifidobacterium tibiigranuli]|uniref:Uncharacterized protein n=2 Tax=Bifidobacterium TaxID=1678 RepID=A0A5N6S6Z5_9BIFI|nr:hypothetical protein DDE84_01095 [Bifidobacterium tibiigranuli]KAE8130438.1 hypothetical protein DDF78_00560 [Bifidobacterium tibiigranuli]